MKFLGEDRRLGNDRQKGGRGTPDRPREGGGREVGRKGGVYRREGGGWGGSVMFVSGRVGLITVVPLRGLSPQNLCWGGRKD